MIADSSFLVSLFLPEDMNHENAKKEYTKYDEYLLIPVCVLEETVNVLIYKRGFDFSLRVSDELLQNERIIVYYPDEDEILETIELMNKTKKKMSMIDYEVAYFAVQKKEALLCFDKQILSLVKLLNRKA